MKTFLSNYSGKQIRIMEVCGTHTAGIFRSGIREILSSNIRLVSGPGCPVCVTPSYYIDECIRLARTKSTTVLTFGDMLKVPGNETNLSTASSLGASVRLIYSPFEAIALAKENPTHNYVIAAVGFETTAPSYALLLEEIIAKKLTNLFLLTSIKKSLTAIDWVLANEESIDAMLLPGHVSVIMGKNAFLQTFDTYKRPMVIGGFEPEHILHAIYELTKMLTDSEPNLINLYTEAVYDDGNKMARDIVDKYFTTVSATWRGLGELPDSGLVVKEEFSKYSIPISADAVDKPLAIGCACADVIVGRKQPDECPLYGNNCTPIKAYGPCMVSSEGACGIWYRNSY